MSRYDGATTAAAAAAHVVVGYMVRAAFDSETITVWTGGFDFSWNAETWVGAGEMLGIEGLEEILEVSAPRVSVALSGIDADSTFLTKALGEPYQQRWVHIYQVYFDPDAPTTRLAEPTLIFAGRADQMEILEAGNATTITLSVESRLADLDRTRERRYTHEDQQLDFPGDLGLEYVVHADRPDRGFGPPGGDRPTDDVGGGGGGRGGRGGGGGLAE